MCYLGTQVVGDFTISITEYPVTSLQPQISQEPIVSLSLPDFMIVPATGAVVFGIRAAFRSEVINDCPDSLDLIRTNLLQLSRPDTVDCLDRFEGLSEVCGKAFRVRPRVWDFTIAEDIAFWPHEVEVRVWKGNLAEEMPLLGI